MFRSSLLFSVRYLWRRKFSSSIKIVGLVLGMSCVLLAVLFIKDESSFDSFHENGQRIYRITTRDQRNSGNTILGTTGQIQGPAFKAAIPEITEFVRLWLDETHNIVVDRKKGYKVSVTYADPNFFEVFSFPLLQGNASQALRDMNSIVITEEMAMKFFGKAGVVGRTLGLEDGPAIETFLITGVAKNLPANSSLKFQAVVPFKFLQRWFNDNDWLNPYLSTFVLLHPNTNLEQLKAKFARVFTREAKEQIKKAGIRAADIEFGLQPIADMHLNIFDNDAGSKRSRYPALANESLLAYSFILGGIAVMIMMMASVNFLNLSISGFSQRSREIGVRKIAGSTSRQLIWHLLAETIVVCIVSFLLSSLMVALSLPVLNQIAEKDIHLSFPEDLEFFTVAAVVLSAYVMVIGCYPAIKLSIFNSVDILKNKQNWGGKKYLSRVLIVLQFSFAMGLIFAVIVYYRQMNFISQKNLGYNPSGIVFVPIPFGRANRAERSFFTNQLKSSPFIEKISNGSLNSWGDSKQVINGREFKAERVFVDQHYIPTLGIEIKSGRNFQEHSQSDSNSVIVNEKFLKRAGWESAVSEIIQLEGEAPKTVIGIIRDFHTGSLKYEIPPRIIELKDNGNLLIKVHKGKTTAALAAIGKAFRNSFPDHFYQFAFLEDEIENHYASEQRWKRIIGYAVGLAIFVCGIGLFGLTHFETLKRRREIGIRKVLGASVPGLMRLVSSEFLKLVLISVIVVSPVVWYMMNNWLQDFSYRIQISWTDMTVTIFAAILITSLTVGIRVGKAAMQNPVDALKG
ncbi:ABC transporter permease [Dyadobacter aurulentus]|uniref:ABC transporter permease n=1 Tax=Dyadobacter sp. UC 10 TaxID=2605428 RepID=UPI0011F198BF|nr:ABC transporter permease [Dyadobacter sp. UC 10]KAA0993497.1 FtsX-like permease family protein [Dyadobacter sp. UC 10]